MFWIFLIFLPIISPWVYVPLTQLPAGRHHHQSLGVSGPVGIYRDKNYSFHQWSICLQTKQVVGIRLTEFEFLCFFQIKRWNNFHLITKI